MKTKIYLTILTLIISGGLMCSKQDSVDTEAADEKTQNLDYGAHELPKDIKWITNDSFQTIASPEAKKGGTFYEYINSFPLTFRTVGPDANSSTRDYFTYNQMSLLEIQPNTEEPVPSLATHWAFDKDGKTMYFKLNKDAKWSDGFPVTADDFIYTLEFMRSKYIQEPWYNNYYTKEIDKVIKYDDYTISVSSPIKKPDLWMYITISPTPKHFYKKPDKDYVKKYNWAIVPNTGPYILKEFSKGKYLIFERKKDWWAKDLKFNKNRFNVDAFKLIVVRDDNVAFEYFKKGKIDSFLAINPEIWHVKGNGELFDKGYIHKIWFYTDTMQLIIGFNLNMDKEIFKDINLRYAFAHAINFGKVNKEVLRGDYERLDSFYTGYGEYTNKKIKAKEYSIAKVEYYMKKSGWKRGNDGIWEKNGKKYSVTISYGSPLSTSRLLVLKEEAKKAGIEFNLEQLDESASYKKLVEKKHEVDFSAWGGSGLRPSPWQYFHSVNAHKPQTNNFTNTDDKEMDRLIENYDISINPKERKNLSHKIQQKIHDICAWIPFYKRPYIRCFYWKWIKHPKVAGTKLFLQQSLMSNPAELGLFWIDEDVKKETLQAMKEGKAFTPVTIIDKTYKSK